MKYIWQWKLLIWYFLLFAYFLLLYLLFHLSEKMKYFYHPWQSCSSSCSTCPASSCLSNRSTALWMIEREHQWQSTFPGAIKTRTLWAMCHILHTLPSYSCCNGFDTVSSPIVQFSYRLCAPAACQCTPCCANAWSNSSDSRVRGMIYLFNIILTNRYDESGTIIKLFHTKTSLHNYISSFNRSRMAWVKSA